VTVTDANETNATGSFSIAILSAGQAPTITAQPANQTINSGQTATLSVAVSGTAPLSYQWYQGLSGDTSNLIAGATSASYTTPVLTGTNLYWVQVTLVGSTVNSATATIIVQSSPTTIQGPPPITPGQTATFPATLPPGPLSVSVQFACTTVTDSQGNVQQASAIGITCTSPVIPLQSVAQNITVTISTTGASAALARPNLSHGSWSYAFWLTFPALFIVGLSPVRGRRLRGGTSRYLLLATVGVLLSLLLGCGGGFNLPQVTSTTTPAGSYKVTVVDNPVNTTNPTGFVQTSLIVPLTVSPTT
jgi:hypothetical protein